MKIHDSQKEILRQMLALDAGHDPYEKIEDEKEDDE